MRISGIFSRKCDTTRRTTRSADPAEEHQTDRTRLCPRKRNEIWLPCRFRGSARNKGALWSKKFVSRLQNMIESLIDAFKDERSNERASLHIIVIQKLRKEEKKNGELTS